MEKNRKFKHLLLVLAGLVLVAVAVLTMGVIDVVVDNDVRHMVPSTHPRMLYCDVVEELFGAADGVIIGLDGTSGLTVPVVELVRSITTRLEIKYDDVMSITNGETIVVEGKTLKPVSLVDEGPVTEQSVAALQERLADWNLFSNMLVSGDGRIPAIIITVPPEWSIEVREKAVADVRRIVTEEEAEAGIEVTPRIAGEPVISLEMGERVNQDMALLSPLALLVVLLVLIISFRSIPGVLGPVVTVGLAVGATFGLMGYLERPVMVISSAIPVFLVAVGSAYGIHVVSHFLRYRSAGVDNVEAVRRTLKGIGPAVVAAALTTVAGFLSLGITEITPMRDFGVFLAFGIGIALIASLTVAPVLLLLVRRRRVVVDSNKRDRLADGLAGLSGWAVRHRILVLAGAFLITTGFGVAAVAELRVDQDAVSMFPESSRIRQSDTFFSTEFGGTHTLSVVVEGPERRSMLEPSILRFLMDLQGHLEAEKLVGKTVSLADFIRRMNYVMHEGNPDFDTIPDSRALIAQYIQLYELSGDTEDFSNVVDFEYRQGHLLVQLRSGAASSAVHIRDIVQNFAAEHLPADYSFELAGTTVRYEVVNSFIVSSQLWSLGLSLIMVFLVVSVLFFLRRRGSVGTGRWLAHSASSGLFTLLPIVIAVITNFGIMALSNITLEIGTAIVAACAVGIGIDYSVHFLHRYDASRSKGGTVGEAVSESARQAGKPILFNALAVAAGFLTLMFSGFLPIRFLGWLTAITMIVTSLAALMVLPALLAIRDRIRT
jgi:uncharacterized protein